MTTTTTTTTTMNPIMAIEHIVLLPFKHVSDIDEAISFIKGLQASAQRKGKPYIRSIKCGGTRVSAPDRTQGKAC
jgi:hypothetical protein